MKKSKEIKNEEAYKQTLTNHGLGSHVSYEPISGKTIRELQKEAYEQAVKTGWHEDPIKDGELICLMHSELSEAMEEIRKRKKPNEIYYKCDNEAAKKVGQAGCGVCKNCFMNKPEGVPIELADCVIRIMDFCGRHDIDLQAAIIKKMEYNKTRPYRHGGKAL